MGYFVPDNMIYRSLIRPALFQLDCEQAHHLAHFAAKFLKPISPLLSGLFNYRRNDLQVNLSGVKLANPVGLAAGFDKNGELVSVLGQLGFGFVEVGSVTARASNGNPRPRLFRLPADQALINRMGLNGDGADVIAERLRRADLSLPVGLNIAKTNDPSIQGDAAVADILYTYRKVRDLPVSFVTINASCPNTSDGIIEEARELKEIFAEIAKDNPRGLPVFVKLSPDSTDRLVEDIVECATKYGIAGYVCGNTTVSRFGLDTDESELKRIGKGGLSGQPLKPLAVKLCRKLYRLKSAQQSIIAVGGIASGKDAYEFISAGASAVQLYTALVYEGPFLPRQINYELSALLERNGLTLAQAVGVAVEKS